VILVSIHVLVGRAAPGRDALSLGKATLSQAGFVLCLLY